MKAPNIRFTLKFFDEHGEPIAIRTVEDLKNNLNVSDLYAYMMDGTLVRWLRCLHENECAERVEKAMDEEDARSQLDTMLSAFGIEVDEADVAAVVSTIEHNDNYQARVDERDNGCSDSENVEIEVADVGQQESEMRISHRHDADVSGRSYCEILQSIRHKVKRCQGHWDEYPADPSQDIAEMLSYHRNQFVVDKGFPEVPEVIPYLYLDCPDVKAKFRFEKVGSGVYVINADKCLACAACVNSCPADAISGDGTTALRIDAATCVCCGACEYACPAEAIAQTCMEWHLIVDGSTTLPLPENCIVGNMLPINGRWLMVNELYLAFPNGAR